ncbi:MAG: hypothetical protein K6F77_01510 [Lachnospiraceae bacterium]|nr:hypothetical protein [Lachnospiraceae bacterium]
MGLFSKKPKDAGKMDFQTFRAKYGSIDHGGTVTIEETLGEYYSQSTFSRELDETTFRYACNVVGDLIINGDKISANLYKL